MQGNEARQFNGIVILPELAGDATWDAIMDRFELSAREREILAFLIVDRSEIAIAELLNIAPPTVHTYVRRLYKKLSVTTRTSAVVRVLVAYITLIPRADSAAALSRTATTFTAGSKVPGPLDGVL